MAVTSSTSSPRFSSFVKQTKNTQAWLLSFILPYLGTRKLADLAKTCKLWNTLVNSGDIILVDYHFSYPSDKPREEQALVLKLFKICALTLESNDELEESEWGLYNRHPIRYLQIASSDFRFTACRSFFGLQNLTLRELSLDETLRASRDFNLSQLRSLCLIRCAASPAPLRQLFLGCSSIRQLEFRCCSLSPTISYENTTFALLPHLNAIRWDEIEEACSQQCTRMPTARLNEMIACTGPSGQQVMTSTMYCPPRIRLLKIDARDNVDPLFFSAFSYLQTLVLTNLTLIRGSTTAFGLPCLRSLDFTQCTLPAVPLDQFFKAAASVTSLSVKYCRLISDSSGKAASFSTLPHLRYLEWSARFLSSDMPFVQLRRMLSDSTSLQKLSLFACDMATDKVFFPSVRGFRQDFNKVKMPTLAYLQMTDCIGISDCNFIASHLHISSCTLFCSMRREMVALPQFYPTLTQLTLRAGADAPFDLTKDPEKIRQAAPQLKELTLENFHVKASRSASNNALLFSSSLTTLRFIHCSDVCITIKGLRVGNAHEGQIVPSDLLPFEVNVGLSKDNGKNIL